MPKSCEDCRCTFDGFDGSTCILGAKRIEWTKRPKDCPLVEPERPQGEWIRKYNGHRADICCTNCGYDEGYSCFKYCPNCGARMQKGGKDE